MGEFGFGSVQMDSTHCHCGCPQSHTFARGRHLISAATLNGQIHGQPLLPFVECMSGVGGVGEALALLSVAKRLYCSVLVGPAESSVGRCGWCRV